MPLEIEPKWQKKWEQDSLYSPDVTKASKPYYSLMMFPYPSAEGLHVGNMYAFAGSDIYSRFKRMQGFDVLEPVGLDGFGIHSENYALKVNQHPMDLSKVTEKRFYKQLHIIGNSYDWQRTVETYKPEYYKWTQWLFLQMYKKGLAHRKKALVNWCPKDLTVLADEQVINGACERCGSSVEKRMLEQWFFKITDYAERLLGNLKDLDWSEKVKIAQRDWIGKSQGLIFTAPVKDSKLEIQTFSAHFEAFRADTFVVIAPDHPLLEQLLDDISNKQEILDFAKKIIQKRKSHGIEEKNPEGIFTGKYIVDPVGNGDLPIWVASYALSEYGTGIVKCSAHDERDFAFAKKYGIRLKPVLFPTDPVQREKVEKLEICFTDMKNGILSEPDEFKEKRAGDMRQEIIEYTVKNGLAEPKTQYHLRDWLISRQRYWGPPIPIIYCDKCGTVPVPEEDLPVKLPYVKEFRPTGTGKSPLASVAEFYNVKCPNCGGEARRETDVSDTFLDSAWYFLRYPSTRCARSGQVPFDLEITKKWLPVNMYIGGAEHSVLHLLYSRFITMVLKDLGFLDFEEPFTTFRAHGLIIKDGAKMSKSKGNIVNPDDYIKEYGADVLRTYLMFVGPFSQGGDFRDSAIQGIYRFMQRVWGFQDKVTGDRLQVIDNDLRMMHKTIKKVTEDIGGLKYNTAIASLMEWLNYLSKKEKGISKKEYETYLLLLAPFAPHITEEIWSQLGEKYSLHKQSWPNFDSKKLEDEEFSVAVQINGKVREVLMISKDIVSNKEVVEKMALESSKVQKHLAGSSVKKVVYIPGKVVSLVI